MGEIILYTMAKRIRLDRLVPDVDVPPPYNSNRILYWAILDRAVRDLEPGVETRFRKRAIQWFQDDWVVEEEVSDEGFTYAQIKEYLDLNLTQIKLIDARVETALQYEETRKKISIQNDKANEKKSVIIPSSQKPLENSTIIH